jgi:alkaline phosphatase
MKTLTKGKIFAVTDPHDMPVPAERGDRLAASALKGIELLSQNKKGFIRSLSFTVKYR